MASSLVVGSETWPAPSRNGSYIALAHEEFKNAQESSKRRVQWRLSGISSRHGGVKFDRTTTLSAGGIADKMLEQRKQTAMSFDIGRDTSLKERRFSASAGSSWFHKLWRDYRSGRWTIVPEPKKKRRVVHWVDAWDILVWVSTLFTVFYVPFDAVMYRHEGEGGRTIHNSLLVVFTVDMLLTFSLAFKIKSDNFCARGTNLWELDPYNIAWHYIKPTQQGGYKSGWFLCDFLCVFPGWLEFVLRYGKSGRYNRILEAASRLSLVARFIAPLIQSFGGRKKSRWDRLMERSHQEYGRGIVGGGRLLNFITTSAVICHWMACAWIGVEGNIIMGLVSYTTAKPSWLTNLIATKEVDPCNPDVNTDLGCVYTLALYWSWTTLSSVGYGDVTPMNGAEYFCCTIVIVISYFLSAYVIGSFASLLSAFMDAHFVALQQDMTLLDTMMDSRGISAKLKSRIRGYMYRSQDVMTMRAQAAFLENQKLSHSLQRQVAEETLKTTRLWAPVWWAVHLSDDILLEMTRFLYPEFFGPKEDVISGGHFLLIIRSGCAAYKGHVLLRGDAWGHESVLLTSPGLIDKTPLKILSYVDSLQLKKQDLQYICHQSLEADRWLRRVQVKTAVRRAVVLTAGMLRVGKSLEAAKTRILDQENSHFSVEHTHTPKAKVEDGFASRDTRESRRVSEREVSFTISGVAENSGDRSATLTGGLRTISGTSLRDRSTDRGVHTQLKVLKDENREQLRMMNETLEKVLQQQEELGFQLRRMQEEQDVRNT